MILTTCLLHLSGQWWEVAIPLMFGFLSRDDVRDSQWANLGRVSTNAQINNTSTETQIKEVREECRKADGTIAYEYEVAESGASINREDLEEIATKGENGDIDILGVSKFDRLMRANPWEAMEYLKRLKEADVTLYVGTHGYFDYDDNFDFRVLVQQVLFSRQWFERLRENAKDGQISELEKGKWPFGTPGYGYEKDSDDYIHLEEDKEKVLAAIFEEYQREKSMEAVKSIITQKFDLEQSPSKSQIETVLENRLCVGDLMLKDRVVARKPELAVVDRETFDEIQEVKGEQQQTSAGARGVPEPVDRAATDYGPEYVIDMIDSLGKQCRKCGGDLRKYGTKERLGTKMQKYKCKDEECGYQGPLLTKKEFKKLHKTLPVKCPYCPATEQFDIEHTDGDEWDFIYECRNCNRSFASDEVEGIHERAKDNPDLYFDWFNDQRRTSGECEAKASANDADAEQEDDDSEGNLKLTHFGN